MTAALNLAATALRTILITGALCSPLLVLGGSFVAPQGVIEHIAAKNSGAGFVLMVSLQRG